MGKVVSMHVAALPLLAALLAAVVSSAGSVSAQQAQSATAPARKAAPPKPAKAAKTGKPSKENSAKALDPEAALSQAQSALAAGKADNAIQIAERVLAQSGKNNRSTARALAVRGEARLKLGRIAEAMADLDSALWVKDGLSPVEREAAVTARAEAFRQAGLGEPPSRAPARTAAASSPAPAPAAPESSAGGGGGVGGFFSSLLGLSGSASSGSTAAIPPPAQPRVATSSSEPQRAGTADAPAAHAGAAHKGPPPARTSAATAAAVTVPHSGRHAAAGQFRLQLAAVRTKAEATALAAKVRKLQPDVLGKSSIAIDEASFGNMGRFFRARLGPFASRVETEAICASIRLKGHDCMVVER